ncbi:MAG: peptidoglycan DD-metalloendopeptidase family protein [Polaromonas sp.]
MSRLALPGALLAALVVAAGCSSSLNNAPVEDRGTSVSRPADVVKPLPGAENAGKPGYYMVKPGDTMIRIGLENGQNWRDIARWNAIENPNLIEVGQVLRVIPPGSDSTQAVTRPVTPGSVTPTLPASAARPASAPVAVTPAPAPAGTGSDEDVNWIWPAQGSLVAGFDEAKNKGLDISGKTGDAVLASADGRVVYAGAGLRGYGNLIILKHNNTFLTAYAHNQTLLVKEDQSVKRGQKIALMGNSDADRVKLHFEIRRQGKPVDPAKYLPAR